MSFLGLFGAIVALCYATIALGWIPATCCFEPSGQMRTAIPAESASRQTEKGGRVVAKLGSSMKTKLGPQNTTVCIPLSPTAGKSIIEAATESRVLLKVVGIEYQENPGAGYEIYLNSPDGVTPTGGSPNYAGLLHFYGLKQAAEASGKKAELGFEIGEVVRRLVQTNQWVSGSLKVTFVRRGPLSPLGSETTTQPPESVPTIQELEIVIE